MGGAVNSDKMRILEMVSEGKIDVREAERLLAAVIGGSDSDRSRPPSVGPSQQGRERVSVEVEAGPEAELSDRREDAFTVGPAPKIIVRGNNGDVSVTPGPDGAVRVQADIDHPELVDYHVSQDGDTVNVQVKRKKGPSKLFDFFTGEGHVDIVVTTPRITEVDVSSGNGDVELRGTRAPAKLHTANGDVSVVDVGPELDLGTVNGDVSVDGSDGSVKLRSTNGDVSVEAGKGVFDAETVNGSVTLEVEMTAGGSNRIKTVNGKIEVELTGRRSLTVDASCVAGSISTEVAGLNASGMMGNRLTGTLGSGEAELVISTVSGSISIG